VQRLKAGNHGELTIALPGCQEPAETTRS
jgi:hypothetical protein